jgi:hypothetical protein
LSELNEVDEDGDVRELELELGNEDIESEARIAL